MYVLSVGKTPNLKYLGNDCDVTAYTRFALKFNRIRDAEVWASSHSKYLRSKLILGRNTLAVRNLDTNGVEKYIGHT